MKIVFLLEEPSMKYLLDELLPRILPEDIKYQTIPHSGKSALIKSLPRKLRGWNEPDVRFVVVCDQDTKICVELKKHLADIELLYRMIPKHQQIMGAKLTGQFMNTERNTSASFNCFVSGVRHFANQ